MTIRLRRDLIRTVTQSYSTPALIPSPTFSPSRRPPLHNHPRRRRLHTSSPSPPPSPSQSPTVAFLHQTHLPFRLSASPHRPTHKQTPSVSCMVCKNAPVVVPDSLPSRSSNDAHPAQSQRHRSSFTGMATTTSTTARAGLIAVGLGIELLDQHDQSNQPVLMDYQPTHPSSSKVSSSPGLDAQSSTHKTVTVDTATSDSSHEEQSRVDPVNDRAFDDDTALSTSTVTTSSEASSLESPVVPGHDFTDEAKQPHLQLTLTFCADVVSLPHPDKAEKGGEDAFFVQKQSLGVFDGVGGWASIGVDAGLYSKELARLTSEYVAMEGSNKVVEGLKYATEKNNATGSSTACVVGLNGDQLVGVNLGDSGLIVIRQGAIVYRTKEQQHYFNCPYQIGTDSLDTVDAGQPIDVKLQHGDWIIMGTDGLWDNVFPGDIVDVVVTSQQEKHDANGMESDEKCEKMDSSWPSSDGSSAASDCSMTNEADEAQRVALELAKSAVKVAMDDRGSSPFAVNAQNAGHLFLGGKIDDITIVAALVVDPEVEHRSRDAKSSGLKNAQTGNDESKEDE